MDQSLLAHHGRVAAVAVGVQRPGEPCEQAFGSSSTVSPEIRRPGSNKIKTLGGDSGHRCLKCSGKLWSETARIIPLPSGITAITSLKYVVSMTETPHGCPRQECRSLSISSDRAKSPRRQACQAIRHRNPRPARQAHRQRRHRSTPALRGSVCRARHGALTTLTRCARFPRRPRRLDRPGPDLRTPVA